MQPTVVGSEVEDIRTLNHPNDFSALPRSTEKCASVHHSVCELR